MKGSSHKRSPTLGHVEGISRFIEPSMALEIFRRMSFCRYFELEVINAFNQKHIHSPVYLALGQEAVPAAASIVLSHFAIFAQHRCHSTYLAFGGDPIKLVDELLGRSSGCNKGKGGSAFVQDPNIKMFPHHSMMGENVSLSVGYALATQQPVVTFFGDAAAEEDYVFGAMGFSVTHRLPVLYICEDNDLSILTPTHIRRNWEITDIGRALGMPVVDISDNPWLIVHYVKEFSRNLPALINVRTCRHLWHVGIGNDGPPEWDRYELVKQELKKLSISFQKIEEESKELARKLWEKQLQRQ